MSTYLFFESRPVWESPGIDLFLRNSALLTLRGNTVDLVLIQNGILMAKKGLSESLPKYIAQSPKMSVWVDEFSLSSRSVRENELIDGVHVISLERIVELFARDGCRPLWH